MEWSGTAKEAETILSRDCGYLCRKPGGRSTGSGAYDAFALDISITNSSAPDGRAPSTFTFQSNPMVTNPVASV